MGIFGEQDVDGGLDVAVLKGVVEDHHLGRIGTLKETADTFQAFLAHGHGDLWELLRHHGGFVAQLRHAVLALVDHITPRAAAVATAEHGGIALVGQQAQQVLDMGSLAHASGADVAHADGGHGGRFLMFETDVEQKIAKPNAYGIPHREWKEAPRNDFAKRHV